MNTKTSTVEFVVVDTSQPQNTSIVPTQPSYQPDLSHILAIKLSELAGMPIEKWNIQSEQSYGHIVTVAFEPYSHLDPVIPVPILESVYPAEFVQAMRRFVSCLLKWSRNEDQAKWYTTAEYRLNDVLRAMRLLRGLSNGERQCMENVLRYALVAPRG